jgi:hypothetical protein
MEVTATALFRFTPLHKGYQKSPIIGQCAGKASKGLATWVTTDKLAEQGAPSCHYLHPLSLPRLKLIA